MLRFACLAFCFHRCADIPPFIGGNLGVPDDDSAVDTARCCVKSVSIIPETTDYVEWGTLTTELGHTSTTLLKGPQHSDRILMHRLQHGIILADLTLQIHLLEHVQRRLLPILVTKTRSSSGLGLLQRACQLPPLLATLEAEGLAIVARSNDLGLSVPEEAHKGQKLRVDADHRLGRLLGRRRVDDGDGGVMRRKRQSVAARAESNGMHPSGRVIQELAADRVERQSLTPRARLGALVGALDEGRKDAGVGIGGTGGEKNAVGVPGDGGDGGPDRLLQVLGYPPVVFLLEVADGDDAVTGADGELGFRGRPADEGGGARDAEEHEGGLVAGGGGFPDEGVAVCELGWLLV